MGFWANFGFFFSNAHQIAKNRRNGLNIFSCGDFGPNFSKIQEFLKSLHKWPSYEPLLGPHIFLQLWLHHNYGGKFEIFPLSLDCEVHGPSKAQLMKCKVVDNIHMKSPDPDPDPRQRQGLAGRQVPGGLQHQLPLSAF